MDTHQIGGAGEETYGQRMLPGPSEDAAAAAATTAAAAAAAAARLKRRARVKEGFQQLYN
jgi:hypothetical protein